MEDKVALAVGHGSWIPRLTNAVAMLRSAAIAGGPLPVRTRPRSSSSGGIRHNDGVQMTSASSEPIPWAGKVRGVDRARRGLL